MGQPETQERYHRTIAEWVAAGRQLPADPHEVLINEITARFFVHAKTYYRKPSGRLSCEYANMVQAIRPMSQLYGRLKAVEFGPLALKAVRQKMVEHGYCRSNINKMVGKLKTIFRWATENELIGDGAATGVAANASGVFVCGSKEATPSSNGKKLLDKFIAACSTSRNSSIEAQKRAAIDIINLINGDSQNAAPAASAFYRPERVRGNRKIPQAAAKEYWLTRLEDEG